MVVLGVEHRVSSLSNTRESRTLNVQLLIERSHGVQHRMEMWDRTTSGAIAYAIVNTMQFIVAHSCCVYGVIVVEKIGHNQTAYMPQWEQYTWSSLNLGIDNGVVREVVFIKKANDTSLRVSWHGDVRIQGCTNCCRRWYFTIDGKECSSPQPIDAAVYQV